MDKSIQDHSAYAGNIGRTEAEHLLEKKPKGSFLIREIDSISSAQKKALERENKISFEACVITYVKEDRIGEYFVIHLKDKWWVYSDNPDLSTPKEVSSSIEELIKQHNELSSS